MSDLEGQWLGTILMSFWLSPKQGSQCLKHFPDKTCVLLISHCVSPGRSTCHPVPISITWLLCMSPGPGACTRVPVHIPWLQCMLLGQGAGLGYHGKWSVRRAWAALPIPLPSPGCHSWTVSQSPAQLSNSSAAAERAGCLLSWVPASKHTPYLWPVRRQSARGLSVLLTHWSSGFKTAILESLKCLRNL